MYTVDFMMAVVLVIEALESRLPECEDEEERRRILKTVARLDGWLERCLSARFAGRDEWVNKARSRLDKAMKKVAGHSPGSERLQEVLAEISGVLTGLDSWWSALTDGP